MKKKTPLTQVVIDDVKRHGAATTDTIARRVRRPARSVSKALSQNKKMGRQHDAPSRGGENLWRNGQPRKRLRRRKVR